MFLRARTLIVTLVLGLSATLATAQTNFWWTNTVATATNGWSDGGNWRDGVAPVSQADTIINFLTPAPAYVTSNNIPTGLNLNQLNFSNSTVTIIGNTLTFTNNSAALPQVNQSGASGIVVRTVLTLSTNTTFGGAGSGQITIASFIGGSGGIIKNGTNYTLALTTSNTFGGPVSVNGGGLLVSNNYALGTSGIVTAGLGGADGFVRLGNGITVSNVTLYNYNNGANAAKPGGLLASSGGTGTWAGNIVLGSTARIAGNGGTLIITGNITDNGNNYQMIFRTGTVILSSTNNSWGGGTVISQDTFKLGAHNALPTNTTVNVAPSQSGTLNFNGFNQQLAGLTRGSASYNAIVTNSSVTLSTLTLSIASGTTNLFYGVLAGNLALNKAGAGVLTLSNAHTYTGATTVNAGTLVINGTVLGSSVTVSGGTLGGTGILGNVSIDSGGTLSPGNSIGTLTVSNLTLNTGAFLRYELAANNASDNVLVLGTLTLNNQDFSSFTFSTNAGFGIGLYTLIDAAATNGAFVDVSTNNFFGYSATLSIGGADGRDLVLNVVPEPGTGALVGAGLLVMFLLRRR